MPFTQAESVIACRIRATYFSQLIENTLNFKKLVGPVLQADIQAVANATRDAWIANMLPQLVNDYIFREVFAADLTTQNSGTATATTAPGTIGAIANPGLPGNVAFVVTFRTAKRGRSFRGRNYVAGLSEAAVTGNTLGGGVPAALVTAYSNIAAAVEALGYQHVIVSRFSNGVQLLSAQVTEVNAYVAIDDFLDSQRRRLTGRGT